jgi:Zinc finger, C2H2 type
MDPPTYHSKTEGRRYRFPTSPDRPSSADSSRLLSDSPTSLNTQLPSQTVYSNIAFPHARPHTSHSFSNGNTRYVHRPSPDYRHSAPDQGARPSSSPHYVSEHPRRLSSLGIRKGIESRRASLPSPPTMPHHPRGSRFWRTVLHDNPNVDRPRFLSSARRSAPVMDRDTTDFSSSSSSYPPPPRPGSPQPGSALLSTSNPTDTHWPSYTRTISETRPFKHVYSIPKSYPPIPPLVFLSSPRPWRTSLPALSSSHDTNMRGAGHLGSRSSELSSLSSQLDDDYDDETEGDDQLESQVGGGVSEMESESEEDECDGPGEGGFSPEQNFQDQQYHANHAHEQILSARSVFSATGATNGDSPQIVRIVELGPSPANPSAVITEDRHYPCPHLGASYGERYFSESMCLHSSIGCPQVCKRRYDLERHLASKQHAQPQHTCDVCGLAFTRKDPLMRHQRTSCKRVA